MSFKLLHQQAQLKQTVRISKSLRLQLRPSLHSQLNRELHYRTPEKKFAILVCFVSPAQLMITKLN